MRILLGAFLALYLSSSSYATKFDCKKIQAGFQASLSNLTQHFEGGDKVVKTKSTEPLEMIKEYIGETQSESAQDYTYEEDGSPSDDYTAGTYSKASAESDIASIAETYYIEKETEAETETAREEIETALARLMKHKVKYGYVGGLQGWGGSPATEVLFLYPSCKLVFSMFLGITHD